jgi:uncharacterized glyoxalase superfamily protein PhnB
MADRKIVHTRHVLAVKDLAVSAAYFKEKLGFDLDFTAPGWEFLSFGGFKVMLGECSDALWAHETGDHSWFAHALVENVDEVYGEFKERGAEIISTIRTQPWGIRDFTVRTPDRHRIVFGELVG